MSIKFDKEDRFGIGLIACWLVCVGDFAVSTLLGMHLQGYHLLTQTESFLGRKGISTAPYMAIWGIVFSILFVLFARAWYDFFPRKTALVRLSTAILVLYGLGEGVGSGLLHFNQINGHTTLSGTLHQMVSIPADIGLFLFPGMAMILFAKNKLPNIRFASWMVIIIGFLINIIFLLGRYAPVSGKIFSWLGLWQRLFLLDYYFYLVFITCKMWHIYNHYKKEYLQQLPV